MADKTEEEIKKAAEMKALQKILEEKYKGYKGAPTDIAILVENIPVGVGEDCPAYGVDCVHEVVEVAGHMEGETETVHILRGFAPKQLAEEMIKAKRAHHFKDLKVVEAAE